MSERGRVTGSKNGENRARAELMRAAGVRLRLARIRADLSQAELGAAAGVHANNIGHFELGHNLMGLDIALALARVLGVKAGWLAFGEGRGPLFQEPAAGTSAAAPA